MNNLTKAALRALIFLAILTSPFSGFGQSAPEHKEKLVQKLVEQMALAERLKEQPQLFEKQFSLNPFGLSAEKNEHLLENFSQAYKIQSLLNDFTASLQQKLIGKYEDKISRWLAEPNTKTVTQAQREFYTLQGKRKRIIAMYEMEKNPASSQRVELINAFIDTTSAVDASVESGAIIFRSLINALNKLNAQQNFSDARINTVIANFRAQRRLQAPQKLRNRLLVTYHGVKAAPLQDYVAFFETAAGRWLDAAISESMQLAYRRAADRFIGSFDTDQ